LLWFDISCFSHLPVLINAILNKKMFIATALKDYEHIYDHLLTNQELK